MELIAVLSLIIGAVLIVAFFIIASNISGIARTLREMQNEQLKIYKALYLIAQSQGIGTKTEKEEK